MKTMSPIALSLLLALSVPQAIAQVAESNPHAQHAMAAKGTAKALVMTTGEVKKIDPKTQTVTLKHGEISNLNMPAMTMVFRAKEAALLKNLNVGDKVRFHAEDEHGPLIVTTVEKAAP